VRNGGLGISRVSSLASSGFLASAAGTRELQDRILHRVSSVNDDIFDSVVCQVVRTMVWYTDTRRFKLPQTEKVG